jgi:hypothetical protein
VASVPVIMDIRGTIASVPWIFMQTIVSPECAHMPPMVCRRGRVLTAAGLRVVPVLLAAADEGQVRAAQSGGV